MYIFHNKLTCVHTHTYTHFVITSTKFSLAHNPPPNVYIYYTFSQNQTKRKFSLAHIPPTHVHILCIFSKLNHNLPPNSIIVKSIYIQYIWWIPCFTDHPQKETGKSGLKLFRGWCAVLVRDIYFNTDVWRKRFQKSWSSSHFATRPKTKRENSLLQDPSKGDSRQRGITSPIYNQQVFGINRYTLRKIQSKGLPVLTQHPYY